jgi:hypothetical protein
MVGTSRDSRDTAYLLGLRRPDFFKRSRDSRDKLYIAVHRRLTLSGIFVQTSKNSREIVLLPHRP